MHRGTAVNACLLDCSKAFDKCKYDLLFEKLIAKGLPAAVVRVLVFMYEEQEGWVKLGGKRSSSLRLTNGTRQGSVYLDDLLVELRRLDLGCHIGGMWYGACGYADDLILLAPNRKVLQQMVSVCERYGTAHNLMFSTDPVPAKSKTKCLLFCGRKNNVTFPAPVKLDGKDLPWVEYAEHLGHTLHQSVTMEKDCLRAKAKFIDKTVEVRNQFAFAHPSQTLKMVRILCCDGYGSMLWELQSNPVEQMFKCWNTCVKLSWEVPRSTFTYLVEGYFAKDETSFRNQILSRYPAFHRKLLLSPSKEVRILSRIVANDPRSTTCLNLRYIRDITKQDKAEFLSSWRIREALPARQVPEGELWRIGLMTTLLSMRNENYREVQDSKNICKMIDSLCST